MMRSSKAKKAPGLVPIAEIPIINNNPMSVRTKFSSIGRGRATSEEEEEEAEWEVRPGGMLVQNRDPDVHASARPLPIRVRVKYGASCHEIHILPHASFGELKKLVSAVIGVHPEDQTVMFKKKKMEPTSFLDISGVKDRSKLVVLDDPIGKAKRVLETMKNSKLEKATQSISKIILDVDHLATQVTSQYSLRFLDFPMNKLINKNTASINESILNHVRTQVSLLDSIITSKGKKVAEKEVGSLIEKLMNVLVKLDAIIIVSDGELKTQRGNLVRRVQKYVETLDKLEIKNSSLKHNNNSQVVQQQKQQHRSKKPSEVSPVEAPVKWETFDLLSSMPSSTTATATATSTNAASASSTHIPRFDWELF